MEDNTIAFPQKVEDLTLKLPRIPNTVKFVTVMRRNQQGQFKGYRVKKRKSHKSLFFKHCY